MGRRIIHPKDGRGKGSLAEVSANEFLGRGIQGSVNAVSARIFGGRRSSRVAMAEKTLEPPASERVASLRERLSEHIIGPREPRDIVEIMHKFKELGMRTVPTFRLATDEHGREKFMMTDLRKLGEPVLPLWGEVSEHFMLCGVGNYNELKERILSDTEKAAEQGMMLGLDAWLLVFGEGGKRGAVGPFIADIGFSGPATKNSIIQNKRFVEAYFTALENAYKQYIVNSSRPP